MAKASRAAALGVAVLFLCGCGTIANLETGARQGWKNAVIYGGVRRDVQSAGKWIDHSWTWGDNLEVVQDIGTVVGVGLVGIDIPLSAIGDTLTLPVTVPIALWSNSVNRTSFSRKTPAPPPAPADPVSREP
jgi:uncharacterized protein YceK